MRKVDHVVCIALRAGLGDHVVCIALEVGMGDKI